MSVDVRGKTPRRFGFDEQGFMLNVALNAEDAIINYPLCEVCANAASCDITDAKHCDGTAYSIVDKDTLMRRMLIETETGDEHFFADIMMQRFIKIYNGTRYEAWSLWIDWTLCPNCEGTGVDIGTHINKCHKCNGTGLIQRVIPQGYHIEYIVYGTLDNRPILVSGEIYIVGIYDNEDTAKDETTKFNDVTANGNQRFKYGKIVISDKLTGIQFGVAGDTGDMLAVIDTTTNNNILYVGDWLHVHEFMDVQDYIDIELNSNGRYVVLPISKISELYHVVNNEDMNKFYEQAFANLVSTALPGASYVGADGLLARYTNKYDTIDKIQKNLTEHLKPTKELYIINDNMIDAVNKVIDDFSLIGMPLTSRNAVKVITDSSSVTDESTIISNIMQYNAVGVYLIEYVVLLKEFVEL